MSLKNQTLQDMALIANDGVVNEAPYPSHNLMPAVVYVGPSKYSNLIRYVNRI